MREYVIAFGIVAAVFAIATLIYVWASIFVESKDNTTYSLIGGSNKKKKKKSNGKNLTWLWIGLGVAGVATLGIVSARRAAKKRKNRERKIMGLWAALMAK